MFKVTRDGNHRLNIYFSGSMTTEEMELALNDFISEAQPIENGTMLYEIDNFEFPSLSAVFLKLSKLPSLFGLLGKFNKAAILTDKKWLQTVSTIEGWLIPGLEIKAFDRDEKAQAEDWLTQ